MRVWSPRRCESPVAAISSPIKEKFRAHCLATSHGGGKDREREERCAYLENAHDQRPSFPWPFRIRTTVRTVFQFRVVVRTPNSLSIWLRYVIVFM
jgi:hypothetical protein